ncbi:hypothetical protein [Methylobacterium sp. Leaf88]|uniref:hypothetical protein n=1 Tax=Methylobacterium sp. Leaf88 TaxID=1736244 RepID=UPI0006F36836|nr:hypothetical protein [Methylobacterium sp. Leaf88]KQO74400.1 hypothetical protein ASF20_03815 [Methylobacterium sp. Leaf88]
MTEFIEHTDGEEILEDGHGVRFILPAWRFDLPVTRGACRDELSDGRRVRTFSIQKGDLSANEARHYAGRLRDAPARAMAVFDASRRDVHPPGKTMRAISRSTFSRAC